MARELKGWARPRPLRVAFLVGDGEHAHLALDGIFADCYNRWGGRFSLIVPTLNDRILPSYWQWLVAYDPDIIYSYTPLSRDDILELYERICPAEYRFHEIGAEPRLDVFGFKPSYRFSPLSSLSTIFRLARHPPPFGKVAPLKIIDSWHTERPSRFLTDNFGAYHVSRGGGIYPPDASVAATLVTVVSPETQRGGYGVPRDLDAIPSEMGALGEFSAGRATSLSVLAALFAPKLETHSSRWSHSFNLVVGDNFVDRVLFWNARLFIPAWLDADICCLRVGLDQLRKPKFLAILGNLLRQRNHVNGGSGGQSHLTVRSASLNADQLKEAHDLVMTTRPWGGVTSETIMSLDEIVPTAQSLQVARMSNDFGGDLFPRPNLTRFLWTPPTARPTAVVPDHLSYAPIRQAFTEGHWVNDFAFEYDGPGPRFSMENRWILPRRWRMAGAFSMSRVSEPPHAVPPPARRSREGRLAIFVSADHPIETIKVPTAIQAMQHALVADGLWAKADTQHGGVYPLSKVAWARLSNEARYLVGVLGMAGGLPRAEQFLLHPFLQKTIAQLGGTPNVHAQEVAPTVNRLAKRAKREPAFNLRDDNERQSLADLIVKAARSLKRPRDFVSYCDIKENWKDYRATYWAGEKQFAHPPDTDVDWDKREEDSLDACLVELRHRQMMFQGHRWTCQKCHHRNWIDIAALSSELTCEVCKQNVKAPVHIPWLFRPNEFLIESLRDHSVLSLVWTLSALRSRSRSSFIFMGPTQFGFGHDSSCPDAEADLLVILDGEAMLCEVKSSWHGLRQSDIDDFVALAIRLRPDIALLAVMDTGTGPVELTAARANLEAQKIDFNLLTLDQYRLKDGPYLDIEDEA